MQQKKRLLNPLASFLLKRRFLMSEKLPVSSAVRDGRRKFLSGIRVAATTVAAIGAIGIEPLLGGKESITQAQRDSSDGLTGEARAEKAEDIRIVSARQERAVPLPHHP